MLSSEQLCELCALTVTKLILKNNWHLWEKNDYIHTVCKRAEAEGVYTKSGISKIAKNEYSQVLYDACTPSSDLKGHQRIDQAYQELGHYLYRIACYQRPDSPEDVKEATQRALVAVYRSLLASKCRNPGAFLAFSIGKLRGALTEIGRGKRLGLGALIPLSQIVADDQDRDPVIEQGAAFGQESFLSPEHEVERAVLAEEIWAELEHKFQVHPRAVDQLRAVIMKHAFGYSNSEVAQALEVSSPEKVSSLLIRGKRKLESNAGFQQLATRMFSQWTQEPS